MNVVKGYDYEEGCQETMRNGEAPRMNVLRSINFESQIKDKKVIKQCTSLHLLFQSD